MVDFGFAINENDLAALSFEVEDFVDRISDLFQRYDIAMNKLSACYKSDGCKSICSYYDSIKKYFPIVKKNIRSYSKDYQELIKILKSEDRKFSGILEDKASNIARKAANAYVDKKNIDIK